MSIEIRARKEQWELKKLDFELGEARDCRQLDSNRSLQSQSDFIEMAAAQAAHEDHKLPEAQFAGWRRRANTDLQEY